jgi:uncharacterized membrane protein YfcA
VQDVIAMAAVGGAALVGFTIAGVAGFGGGPVILPVLIWVLGPRDAIPILSMAQFLASAVRFLMYRPAVAWPVIRWYSLGAIPVAILSSLLFVITPPTVFIRVLGAGMLLLVAYRYTPWSPRHKMSLWGFSLVGVATSGFSGFLGIGGPVPAPFLLAYGLAGGAYVGTMGGCTWVTQLFKLVVFGNSGLLTPFTLAVGTAVGAISWIGALLGKRILHRIPEWGFHRLIEALLIAVGLLFLLRG